MFDQLLPFINRGAGINVNASQRVLAGGRDSRLVLPHSDPLVPAAALFPCAPALIKNRFAVMLCAECCTFGISLCRLFPHRRQPELPI